MTHLSESDLRTELQAAQRRIQELEQQLALRNPAGAGMPADEQEYRTLVESSPYCIKVLDADGRVTSMNRAGLGMVDEACEADVVGQHMLTFVSDHDQERVSNLVDRALTGEASEFEFLAAVGLKFRSTLVPLRDEQGKITRLLSITLDVTDQQRLIDELDHRVKNNLAAVLALAEQTMQSARTPDDFFGVFSGRIQTLARSHEALAAARWTGVQLHELIGVAVGAQFGGDESRLSVNGDDVLICPRRCGPIALILHEMTTNAIKHGALASQSGRIEIKTNADDQTLTLVWSETSDAGGGSFVPGVGLGLIRGFVEFELKGGMDVSLPDAGLAATFTIPLDSIADAMPVDVGSCEVGHG